MSWPAAALSIHSLQFRNHWLQSRPFTRTCATPTLRFMSETNPGRGIDQARSHPLRLAATGTQQLNQSAAPSRRTT